MSEEALAGPGKYDPEATIVRELTAAEGVGVIVAGGNRGAGFSVQGSAAFIAALPDILESIARGIREQRRGLGH